MYEKGFDQINKTFLMYICFWCHTEIMNAFYQSMKNVTKKFSSSIVLGCTIFDETRLHSSRMHTARLLTVSRRGAAGVPARGVFLPMGVTVYLPGGCTCRSGAPAQWGCTYQGGYLPHAPTVVNVFTHVCDSVCLQGQGVCPIACWDTPPGRHPPPF